MTELLEHIARVFEGIGAAVLVVGLVLSTVVSLRRWLRTRNRQEAYQTFRESFGGMIMLSLEILVAADLIETVAIPPTLTSVATLGLVVLIRTFVSFSLMIEIEGVVPWRRAFVSGAKVTSDAVRRAERVPD